MAQSTLVGIHKMWSRVLSFVCLAALLVALPAQVSAAAQDPVLEWMQIANDTILAAGTPPLFAGRQVAMVSSSVFDAVNGIERRYQPIHVRAKAAHDASRRAAAIQAAYAMLIKLYTAPAQVAALTARRNASIAAIASGPGADRTRSIEAGVLWGQFVAESIWALRATDGFDPNPAPPFLGVLGRLTAGVWRPTPRADALPAGSGAGPQFATMTPWVMRRASQFRPAGPYASLVTGQPDFTSAQYLADYQETKRMGAYSGPRTPDQSELALFWAGSTVLFWIRIASQISAAQHLTLSENAHLFALLNVAMADAAIACWDAKYRFVLWRPITAVREGSIDPDPTWKPWLDFFAAGTPAHPEFPSGHSTVSGAAAFILAAVFGDHTAFNVGSETRPGVRAFPSFSAALAEIHDARVFGGIHWRTACLVGSAIGQSVAAYVSSHAMQLRDRDDNDDRETDDRR
jgi:membrane-associated phospholipid phosphatase